MVDVSMCLGPHINPEFAWKIAKASQSTPDIEFQFCWIIQDLGDFHMVFDPKFGLLCDSPCPGVFLQVLRVPPNSRSGG